MSPLQVILYEYEIYISIMVSITFKNFFTTGSIPLENLTKFSAKV